MQLDKRIINGKRPLTCFDIEEAEKYIGKRGYFSNNLGDFSDLVNNRPKNGTLEFGTLWKIHNNLGSPFYMKENVTVNAFFIPECFVKPKEKQYRPYTIEEFCNEGFEIVVFRNKNDESIEYHVRYNGYIKYDNGDVYLIIFGRKIYPLNELFENFEYLDSDGNWKPFGVEE